MFLYFVKIFQVLLYSDDQRKIKNLYILIHPFIKFKHVKNTIVIFIIFNFKIKIKKNTNIET